MSRRWILPIVAVFLAGCFPFAMAPPPSPVNQAFADNRAWILKEDMIYVLGNTDKKIVIPRGFVTDYASVPQALWGVLSPHDHYSRSAVIHDFLYWTQSCTRPQSDNILKIAMRESAVPAWKREAVYFAVDKRGQSSWDENAELKSLGYVRVVVGAARPPRPNETWFEYREELRNSGVREPIFGVPKDVCSLGDVTDIPRADG